MDARAIRSRFSRLGWWPRVRRLCTRSASLMTSTRRSIEAARIILRNVSRLGVIAPLGPVELGDPVDEDRDLRAELRLHLADRQAGVLHRVVQQRGHQRGGVHPDVREQDRHRERVGDVGRARLADLPGVPVVGDVVGVAEQPRVGAGEDPAVGGDQRPHRVRRVGRSARRRRPRARRLAGLQPPLHVQSSRSVVHRLRQTVAARRPQGAGQDA